MRDLNPTLNRLKNADPIGYARLCERAGCYSAASEYYSTSSFSGELLHAAELFVLIGDRKNVRKLCGLARAAVDAEIERAQKSNEGALSGMGSAMVLASRMEAKEKLYAKTQEMLDGISRKNKL